jgi:hypothetical protein
MCGIISTPWTFIVKPEQLPHAKNGEQLPLQSSLLFLGVDDFSVFISSLQKPMTQQGIIEQNKR